MIGQVDARVTFLTHLPRVLILSQLASTLFLTGLIWFVQVIHYPLFEAVGRAEFVTYEQRHTSLIQGLVAPPMLLEGISALLLLWFRPPGVSTWRLVVGLILVGIIGFSTAFLQMPCHDRLSQEFDTGTHQWLVTTNWIRTVAWSLRGGLVLWMTWDALK